MDIDIARLGKIVLVSATLLILLQASVSLINADSIVVPASIAVLPSTYATVGPGKYEAECASRFGSWATRKAKRASKTVHTGCPALSYNYIESTSPSSSVCLNFSGASRVGIGFVAGNYKGKAAVSLYKSNNVLISTKTLNTYDEYSYNEPSGEAMDATAADIAEANGTDVHASDDTIGAYEGDVDTSAPDAKLSFWAFKWMWGDTDELDSAATKICVSPKGAPSARPMVSLDYFVIGNGPKIAQRGYARIHDFVTRADIGGGWNYNACGFGTAPGRCQAGTGTGEFLPANGSDAWEEFVPKVADPSNWESDNDRNNFITDHVNPVINGARNYGGGANTYVPKYWILYNEPDAAGFFFYYDDGHRPEDGPYPQPLPNDPNGLHGFVNVVWAIRTGYSNMNTDIVPKIILESGSQIHAPGTSSSNHWAEEYCPVDDPQDPNDDTPDPFDDVPWKDRNGNSYWGCTNPNRVWISDFWSSLKADMLANPTTYPMTWTDLKASVAGIGGHYYPGADTQCQLPSCYLNTNRIGSFVDSLTAWRNNPLNDFSGTEIWLVETATHLTEDTGCLNFARFPDGAIILTVNEQRDNFKCQDRPAPQRHFKYLNVRNYIGRLQEALATKGVSRWAWFAERYGRANPCADNSGGELTAMNDECGFYKESPFGNNFALAAPYR